jgi:bifunctional UDP-N-acetylglucosamine pyrophosphorylase/glucosamine-1-phosphate N-acetyltransferase
MSDITASLIFAAGRGSRMKDVNTNKTLFPLVESDSLENGSNPILLEILKNLPSGPKAVVVNYKKEDVIQATSGYGLIYCEQPELNGTGGALLAAQSFLKENDFEHVIITMGDVPFVKKTTYGLLVQKLKNYDMVVLGFQPESKKQYGVLDIDKSRVTRITEWEYWKKYPLETQRQLKICNSGIYAIKKETLMRYLSVLGSRPHTVHKTVKGQPVERKEYFITDIIEYMDTDGLSVGYVLAKDEDEVMGIDNKESLKRAREIFGADRKLT